MSIDHCLKEFSFVDLSMNKVDYCQLKNAISCEIKEKNVVCHEKELIYAVKSKEIHDFVKNIVMQINKVDDFYDYFILSGNDGVN